MFNEARMALTVQSGTLHSQGFRSVSRSSTSGFRLPARTMGMFNRLHREIFSF
jgi:hypothetical protein